MSMEEIIIRRFYIVADRAHDVKPPNVNMYSREIATIELLYVLKGHSCQAFYCWRSHYWRRFSPNFPFGMQRRTQRTKTPHQMLARNTVRIRHPNEA